MSLSFSSCKILFLAQIIHLSWQGEREREGGRVGGREGEDVVKFSLHIDLHCKS